MLEFQLDYMRYLGDLSVVPDCVLLFLCKSMGGMLIQNQTLSSKARAKLITKLNELEPPTVNIEDLEPKLLPQVALFVNPDVNEWNKRNVTKALSFIALKLQSVNREDIIKYPLQNACAQNPETINIILAYLYCMKHKLEIKLDASHRAIYNACKLHSLPKDAIISLFNNLDVSSLTNMLSSMDMKHQVTTSRDRLCYWASVIRNDPNKNRLPDKEREYYIAWSAIHMDINLYDFEYPQEAASNFPNYQAYEHKTIPKDTLILRCNFDPRLPYTCYKASSIKNLLLQEGLVPPSGLSLAKASDQSSAKEGYDMLISHRKEITFYQGKHNSINTDTPISYDSLDEIPEELCISYGKYDACITMTITELCDHFLMYRDFIDFDLQPIATHAINKLKLLSKDEILLRIICDIETRLANLSQDDKIWIRCFQGSRIEIQEAIRTALNKVMVTGMYMRGWDGTSPNTYPMNGDTLLRDDNIASNVGIAMVELDEYLTQEKSIKDIILNLPLRAADTISNKFHWKLSTVGSTLKDRLDLVNKNDTSDVNTCIRTSSNWLVGAAYYYGTLVGMSFGFEIQNIRYIL